MVILGLNYYYHDSTACIVVDGSLIAAIEEERLNRDKHTREFPKKAIDRCLKIAKLSYDDIDHIAVSIQPKHNSGKKLLYWAFNTKSLRSLKAFINNEILHAFRKQRGFWGWYKGQWVSKKKGPKVHFIPHHNCHAPGSFFVSPYKKAALLGVDGSGEWATTWLGYGNANKVEIIGESFFPYSLGSFYVAVTYYCGFKPYYDEGKTMGLAPLGNPKVYKEDIAKLVWVDDIGKLHFDLSYFNFQNLSLERLSPKFYKKFGKGRKPNEEFTQHHMDMAAAFQEVLEDCVLEICDVLYKKTKTDYLIVSGGVALNSVMNGRIVRESKFKDIYVMPAAGDNGTAIGAAYYLYNGVFKKPRTFIHLDPYVGTSYSNKDIKRVLKGSKLNYKYFEDISDKGAELLAEGNIIGWFQGKMEIGPRALGNRSILANPNVPTMKDKINAEVKFREAYRPFAPSTILEAKDDYFDLDVEAPFMLKVCNVLKEKQDVIPAVTHVDGSARLQTVTRGLNPRYYDLIKKLGNKTGVPVVLNTSFNVQGEPVVESPVDAIRCFFSTGLDALIIGNYLLRK
ncbi:carbamoyltransferase [Winogradskyella sp. PG-2]|uniref:carbamoyltransferase family protein n=1 Tax=Winogradskyella sp. PG-2 TaxID=754409 RepID=UPI0004588900|nr:carbamoyltransferase C-terminal domain-containing protein [Winogradskyella sp. PG-2]BAO75040.1 nodulation protein nolO [Winogradskyella sp. PG-2]